MSGKTKHEIDCIIEGLKSLYPVAFCALQYKQDYELLFAVRLSAQCTDERVNKIAPVLFHKYPSLLSIANADVTAVEEIIRPCGYYHAKAKDIVNCAKMLITKYNGKVPDTMEDLLSLPGVGRKTANLILGDVFGKPGCIVADTHCIRISGLIGLTDGTKDPVKTEEQLRKIIPPEESNDFCHRLVLHGRSVCIARHPHCEICSIKMYCDHYLGGSH